MLRCIVLCLCLLWLSLPAGAQLQVWRHINTAEMANTNIMCMTEDANGLIYLGTQDGIEVFDGRRFMPIVIPDRIQKGINPFVNSMRWGRGGILWVATRTHIYTYDPANGAVNVLFGKASLIDINLIELDTARQRLHIVRYDGITSCDITDTGLVQISRSKFPVVNETALAADGSIYALLSGNVQVVKVEGNSHKVLYTAPFIRDLDYLPQHNALVMLIKEGLVTLSLNTGKIDTLPVKPEWDYFATKTRISVHAPDQVLVHDPDGLSLVRNLTDTLALHYSYDEKNTASIQTNFIIYSFTDRHNNIWISEDGITISVLPANSSHVRYVSTKMTGAARLWLSYHDTANKQILSSSERGLCVINYNSNRASYKPGLKPHDSLKFFEPMVYWPWTRDEIMIATNGQNSWLFNPKTYRFRAFDSLNKALPGNSFQAGSKVTDNLYLLYGYKGMYAYDRHTGVATKVDKKAQISQGINVIAKDQYFSSYVDKERKMWLGGGSGVAIMDTTLQFLKSYGGVNDKKRHGLGNTVILDIDQAADGTIYVATMGGGVYRLSAADTFVSVPLVGNVSNIYCIGILDDNNILFTTSKGMCLYNCVTKESRLINEQYGMPIVDFNQFALSVDNEFVIASGSKGIAIIDRQGLTDCFYDTAQLLVMKGMKPVTEFILGKGKQLLDFDVAIAGYAARADWHVRYKLDGLDDDWRDMAKGEWHIRYNSIKPGGYTLFVEATDGQNVIWAAPAKVKITALPYFWQTLWFRILVVLLGIGVLVVTVRFFSQLRLKWKLKKMEDEQKLSRERIRISRELHDNVGSQLTYLITGLESSQMLLNKQETEVLEKKIEKMQSSARESMQQLRDSIWALNSETVEASVLVSRFGKWLENIMEAFPATQYVIHSDITTDVDLDPIKSLNLFRILQEAVHNVLKHAQATMLTINYSCSGNMLTIRIEDNGKGFDPAQGRGNGMRTMASRAEEMGAIFSLSSVAGEGTKIKIIIALT